MALSDPISEFLTKIRNAKGAQHRFVDFDYSKIKYEIVKVLNDFGFIESYLVDEEQRKLRLYLRYTTEREPVIQGLKRISSPGMRLYVKYRDIPKIREGLGIAILSTPKGVLEGETARKQKLGGELLCLVW